MNLTTQQYLAEWTKDHNKVYSEQMKYISDCKQARITASSLAVQIIARRNQNC